MGSVRSNFIWNSAYQVVRIATPLITTPYLTRVLGSEPLGVYSYTYTIAMYFTYFVLLGLNQYGNREVAKARENRASLSKVFWSIYLGQVAIGTLVSAFYLLYVAVQSDAMRLCALIWFLWIAAEVADIGWLLYGLEEFKVITIRNVLIRVVVVAGIILLVKQPEDLWIYCLLQAGSFILNSATLWVIARRRIDWYRPSAREITRNIRPSLVLFAPVIAISCYTQLNKIILGSLSGMSQVAFYDNADKVVTIPLTIIQSLGTVLLPRMSNVLAGGDAGEEKAQAYLSESFWLSMLISIGLVFGILGASEVFVPVFFGDGFEACVTLMPTLSLIIPACALSSVVGNQFLIPSERDSLYLRSVLAGAVVNIALCLILIPSLSAMGAALATVAAEIVVAGVQMWYARRELPFARYFRRIAPYVLMGAIEFACIKAVPLTGLVGWGLLLAEIAVGASVFASCSLAYLIAKGDEALRYFGLSRFIRKSER